MKRILVPSDLSDVAEEGLKMAVKLAAKLNSEIYLVNFFEPPSVTGAYLKMGKLPPKNGSTDVAYRIEMVRENKSKLALLASHYAQQDVTINYDIVNERLKDGVAPYTLKHEIDLVVMGTYAENTEEERFTGNQTEQVSEKVPCPVITVSTTNGIDLNTIVVVLDKQSLGYLDLHKESLKEMVEQLCSEVYILCVIKPTEKVEQGEIDKIKSFTNSLENTWSGYKLLLDADNERSVAEFAQGKRAGIISLFTSVKNGFLGIINDNFSKRILSKTNIPILNIDPDNK